MSRTSKTREAIVGVVTVFVATPSNTGAFGGGKGT